MKLEKVLLPRHLYPGNHLFQGKDDEDFDPWWEEIRAFFALYQINVEDKVRLENAHKGGDARRVVLYLTNMIGRIYF